jgi:hypothetical protein
MQMDSEQEIEFLKERLRKAKQETENYKDDYKQAHERQLFWLDKCKELDAALRDRLRSGHNDTCGAMLGDYPCSCGQESAEKLLAPKDGGV